MNYRRVCFAPPQDASAATWASFVFAFANLSAPLPRGPTATDADLAAALGDYPPLDPPVCAADWDPANCAPGGAPAACVCVPCGRGGEGEAGVISGAVLSSLFTAVAAATCVRWRDRHAHDDEARRRLQHEEDSAELERLRAQQQALRKAAAAGALGGLKGGGGGEAAAGGGDGSDLEVQMRPLLLPAQDGDAGAGAAGSLHRQPPPSPVPSPPSRRGSSAHSGGLAYGPASRAVLGLPPAGPPSPGEPAFAAGRTSSWAWSGASSPAAPVRVLSARGGCEAGGLSAEHGGGGLLGARGGGAAGSSTRAAGGGGEEGGWPPPPSGAGEQPGSRGGVSSSTGASPWGL